MSLDLPHSHFIETLSRAGAEIYLVGGSVRDWLLHIPHKDYDLVVRHVPYTQIVNTLQKMGHVVTVGKSFGIIKFSPSTNTLIEYDIALPRTEKSTGAGHTDFEVHFDPALPLEHDLSRRDFTINAMAYDLKKNQLIDPFNGKIDLEKRILRQVFTEAFAEDPLRLLRAIQFAARFQLTIDPITLESMRTHAALIREISQERIIEEIRKLFLATKPSVGFDIMRDVGLLKLIFPFVDRMIGVLQPKKKNEDVYAHTMKVLDAARSADELEEPGNMELMFSALLHDAGKPNTVQFDPQTNETTFYGHQIVSRKIAQRWLRDFKASSIGLNTEQVSHLVNHHMFETKHYYSDKALRRFIRKIGPENIFRLIDLRIADKKGGRFPDSMKGILKLREKIRTEIEKEPPFTVKDLVVNGHDIMDLGFPAGPIIGKIQKFLMEKVLDEPELNEKEKLIHIIKDHFSLNISIETPIKKDKNGPIENSKTP